MKASILMDPFSECLCVSTCSKTEGSKYVSFLRVRESRDILRDICQDSVLFIHDMPLPSFKDAEVIPRDELGMSHTGT